MVVVPARHIGYAGLVDLKTGDVIWFNADPQMGGDVRTEEGAAEARDSAAGRPAGRRVRAAADRRHGREMSFLRCVNGAVIASLLCAAAPPPLRVQSRASAPAVDQPSAAPTPAGPDGATHQSAIYTPQDKDERGLWMEVDEQERKLKNSNFVIHDPALNAYVHDVFTGRVGLTAMRCSLYIVQTLFQTRPPRRNGMIQVWSGLFLRRDEAQLAACCWRMNMCITATIISSSCGATANQAARRRLSACSSPSAADRPCAIVEHLLRFSRAAGSFG